MSILLTVALIVIVVSLATRWFAVWLAYRLNRKATAANLSKNDFAIKPYLQLGNPAQLSDTQQLEIHWHTSAGNLVQNWSMEIETPGVDGWRPVALSTCALALPGVSEMTHFKALVSGLEPGHEFKYRIFKSGQQVFAASALPAKKASQPYRFAVYGDLANGKEGSKKIAYQVFKSNPDFVAFAGDVVYQHGRSSEYLERYFPVYNHDSANPEHGAPLLRSRLFMTAPGNHDMGTPELWDVRDLNVMPDLLAYFIFWSQPLNGPLKDKRGKNTPDLLGDPDKLEAFFKAAGPNYPQMANFSFDYANAHWTMLDSNNYVDWTDGQLREWLENDLSSSSATWKFVCFHHPGFSCDPKHITEQRMRLLCELFEKHGVDIVFCGHNHAYERNFPLKFKLQPQADGSPISAQGLVDGQCLLDKDYNGSTLTKLNGVLYLISGGGGGKLLALDKRANPIALPPFTCKLVDDIHTFTYCDVDGRTLTFHQISEDGIEIDRFVVTK